MCRGRGVYFISIFSMFFYWHYGNEINLYKAWLTVMDVIMFIIIYEIHWYQSYLYGSLEPM